MRRSKAMNGSGVARSAAARNVSARALDARESWLATVPTAPDDDADGERRAGSIAGAAAALRVGQPAPRSAAATANSAAGATSAQVQQAARHVAVAHVAELVRDDEATSSRVKSLSSVS